MFSVIHPLLLWGTAAAAVPILIHLLLRQRPQPRPWAAMRWLLAAIQKAQRRYRLTNLLLLLMRCLLILLAALAVARPNLAGLGSGGKLVLIVDATASMGARGDEPGPLAEAKAALAHANLPDRVAVIELSDRPYLRTDGSIKDALAAVDRIAAGLISGGLDRAADASLSTEVLAACGDRPDVILVSDFQQDDGELLAAMLKPRCRSVARLRVGKPSANAVITGLEAMPDLVPAQGGELLLRISGQTEGVSIAVDGGPSAPTVVSGGGDSIRLALPPMEAGEHRLGIELQDHGLAYDNLLELPISVRPPVATLTVSDHTDYLSAALAADTVQLSNQQVRPSQLGVEQLPARGLLALRGRIGDGERVSKWITAGGVVWAQFADLKNDARLQLAVAGVAVSDALVPGGAFNTGEKDIDDVLSLGSLDQVAHATLPANAEVLLRAGREPIVAAIPCGGGWTIVELTPLSGIESLEARGTTPLWVRRTARRFTARINQPQIWQAGLDAPATTKLERLGHAYACTAGKPVLAAPGLWSADSGTNVILLPNLAEAHLEKRAPPGAVASIDEALPRRLGSDWGLALLLAALLVLIGEGLLAAWAGSTYGK